MATRGESWSREEVEATVASYFEMLEAGLRGEDVNKTEYRNALLPLLVARTGGAIERKHQNISAILIEVNTPYISGYQPLGNYQGLLRDVVLDQLIARRHTRALIEAEIERVPSVPTVEDILGSLVGRPAPRPGMSRQPRKTPRAAPTSPVDYLLVEARNRALGRAGEEFILRFETARLIAAKRERLAAKIDHVAVTQGDGPGFDILSFDDDGRERFVEVKTTKFGEYTPFYVSRNELAVSQRSAPSYHLYRVHSYGADAKLFVVSGALDHEFGLEPTTYLARVS
jgi:uncharacterized protein DUF3883